MLTRIQNTTNIAAIIRSQVESMRRPLTNENQKTSISKGESLTSGKSKQDIGSRIIARVKGISADDPNRRAKAFRVFLESILSDELGEAVISDPRFYAMVDNVEEQMRSDSEILSMIENAVDLLLDSVPPSPLSK